MSVMRSAAEKTPKQSFTMKQDFLDRLFWRFAASLQNNAIPSRRLVIAAICVVVFFAILLALSPTVLISDYFYDVFIPLDGALRSLNGQWPHLDFYTPIGDLYYVLLGLSARIFGFTPKIVLWQQILVLPFALFAITFATRNRLPSSLRVFLILMIGLLCISPGDLDRAENLSFLASYNRTGWVFMTPLLAAALLEPLPGRRQGWIGDSVFMSLLVILLFFMKMTFALVAIITLVIAAIWAPKNRRSCIGAVLLTAAVIAVIALSGPLIAAYLSDLHRTSLASPITGQHDDPFRLFKLKAELSADWFELIAPLSFALWLSRSACSADERDNGNRILLLCTIATAGNVALSWQDHENAMPSQIIAMAIAFAGIWIRQANRELSLPVDTPLRQAGWPPVILAGFVFSFIASVSILDTARSVILHVSKTTLHLTQPVATLSPYLQGLTVPPDSESGVISDILAGKMDATVYSSKSEHRWPNDLAPIMDDGWRLFQANKPQNPRIATIYMCPVMTVLTRTTPPLHMAAWMDIDRTVGALSPMVPERDFSDVNVVMIFKLYDHDTLYNMVRDYVTRNFHVVGETPIWQMWVRNGE